MATRIQQMYLDSQPKSKSTRVTCIKVAELRKQGYRDLLHWLEDPNHIYIGRNMVYYVPGSERSKWCNNYTVKKYGREECLKLYKEHVIKSGLIKDIEELRGMTMGCWCSVEEPCHGKILIELLEGKK
ncbi:MAG: DUF4326 domain-containing protein [Nitrososphaerales archaeon]